MLFSTANRFTITLLRCPSLKTLSFVRLILSTKTALMFTGAFELRLWAEIIEFKLMSPLFLRAVPEGTSQQIQFKTYYNQQVLNWFVFRLFSSLCDQCRFPQAEEVSCELRWSVRLPNLRWRRRNVDRFECISREDLNSVGSWDRIGKPLVDVLCRYRRNYLLCETADGIQFFRSQHV